ncbi:WD repeat-containing protein LWD2, partial [Diplonema papillatum]
MDIGNESPLGQEPNAGPGGTTPGNSNAKSKRKEIYTYECPYAVNALSWSVRKDKPFRLAVASYIEGMHCFHQLRLTPLAHSTMVNKTNESIATTISQSICRLPRKASRQNPVFTFQARACA